VGSDFGAWTTGTTLLADSTLAAVRELLFFLLFKASAEAAWAYNGWGLGQSGARCPEMKVVGSGYFPKKTGGFFSFSHIIYSLLRYKKLHGAQAMAKTKPTELTTHTHITASWEKAKPLKTRERPPPNST